MSNETAVAVQEEAGVPQVTTLEDMGMSAQDLLVDRLLLMQNTSEMVGEEKAKLGDMILSNTKEVIGGVNAPLEIIPLDMFKTWRIMDVSGKTPDFMREEPMTAANEKDPWEFQEKDDHGKLSDRRRDYGLHFFALLMPQVEADEAFPVMISFRRTSVKAGKALATQLFKMVALGRAKYSKTATLSVGKDKFDTNTYAFFEIGPGQPTNEKGLAAAKLWLPRVKGMRAKVDWSKENTETEKTSAPGKAPVVVSDDAPGTAADGPY